MGRTVSEERNGDSVPSPGTHRRDGVADRLGGYHLGRQADEQETIRIVRTR